jgi:hypothetical protein
MWECNGVLVYAAFKTLGSFGGSDLKLGRKCFEHAVGSEFHEEVKQPKSSEVTS